MPRHFDVVVIGAGQAGLAMGYYLAQTRRRFILLDAGGRIGDVWRQRWDSLKLFTPAEYDGLPGMPFPAPAGHQPSKDEVANYLEAYTEHFSLPVQLDTRVSKLAREGRTYSVALPQVWCWGVGRYGGWMQSVRLSGGGLCWADDAHGATFRTAGI